MVRTSLAASLLLIVTSLLIAPVGAQDPQAGDPFGSPPTISFTFKGGTVAQYVELLHKHLRERNADANIIVKSGAQDVELPSVELRNVTVESALQLLHDHVDAERNTRLDLGAVHGGGAPIYVLYAASAHLPSNEETVHVWNVRQLLDNEVKAEDMLTAIETAMTLLRSTREPAELRFHEATGLVMARGTKDQVRTIELVIQQLRETAIHQEMEAMRRAELEQAAAMRADATARMQMEMESAQEEMSRFKQEREAIFLEMQAAKQNEEMRARENAHLQEQLKVREQELRDLERNLRGKE